MRITACVALLLVVSACGGGGDGTAGRTSDTLTTRQQDSLLENSRLPALQGVRGAQRAADRAQARNAQLDSIAGSN